MLIKRDDQTGLAFGGNKTRKLEFLVAKARDKGTADENKAAVAGGIGLYGTYTVANKVLMLKTEGSTYPNWTDTELKRDITTATANDFTWTLTNSLGGKGEVSWQRIK